MTDSKYSPTHEEIMQLLPWYATGSLSATENQLVADYLEKHPELLSEVKLIQTLQESVNSNVEVPAADTQRLLQKLDTHLEKQTPLSRLQQLIERLLTPSPLWAAIPAALVLALGLLWIPQQGDHEPGYETLSTGEQPAALRLSLLANTETTDSTLLPLLRDAAPSASIILLEPGQYQLTLNTIIAPDQVLQLILQLQAIQGVQEVDILTQ